MAHQFESGFFASNTPAWHGLGTVLDHPPTIAEAIKAAGLDWQVREQELFTQTERGLGVVPTHKALVRSTDYRQLGIVSQQYQPLQNLHAFNFFDFLLHDGDVSLEAAGSLKEGKRIWVLAKINNLTQDVVQNDAVNPYLLLSNSHDGSLAVWIQFTPIRVCCNNTLSYALSKRTEHQKIGRAFSIRHQGDIQAKLAQAQRIRADRRLTTTGEAKLRALLSTLLNNSSQQLSSNINSWLTVRFLSLTSIFISRKSCKLIPLNLLAHILKLSLISSKEEATTVLRYGMPTMV